MHNIYLTPPSVVCILYLVGVALGVPPERSPGEEEEEEDEKEEEEEDEMRRNSLSLPPPPPPPTAASAKGGITNTPLTRTQVTVHVTVHILQPLLLTPPLSPPRSRRTPLQTRGRRAHHHRGEGRRLLYILNAIFTTFVT
jgi:hypothetical protein